MPDQAKRKQGLDEIDWHSLTHAYGPASDVPGQIRDLASPDAETRRQAMHALYGNIWHQGTVYEATAYAVPFLIELLEAQDLPNHDLSNHDLSNKDQPNANIVPPKDEILILLSNLANGSSYMDAHQHLSVFKEAHAEETKTEAWRSKLQQELSWVRKATEAVQLGRPTYVRLLAHPEATVRDAAAFLLASLHRPGKNDANHDPLALDIANELSEGLEIEFDETVKASMLLAFGVVCRRDEPSRNRILEFLSHPLTGEHHHATVRLAAAMSLVRFAPARVPRLAIDLLLDAVQHPGEYASLEKSYWADGEPVSALVCRYLVMLEREDAAGVEKVLCQALSTERAYPALTITEALLALLFPGGITAGTAFNDLNERQQHVLKALAANHHIWGVTVGGRYIINANASYLMRSYGLPCKLEALEAFVSGESVTASG